MIVLIINRDLIGLFAAQYKWHQSGAFENVIACDNLDRALSLITKDFDRSIPVTILIHVEPDYSKEWKFIKKLTSNRHTPDTMEVYVTIDYPDYQLKKKIESNNSIKGLIIKPLEEETLNKFISEMEDKGF